MPTEAADTNQHRTPRTGDRSPRDARAFRTARSAGSSTRPGFSLLEITLVLVIIGLLLAGAAVAIGPAFLRAQERTTRSSMETIKSQIEAFRIENKRLPDSLAELVPGYLEQGKMLDGWDNDYYYAPGDANSLYEYELMSAGKDLEFGTDDDLSVWDGLEEQG